MRTFLNDSSEGNLSQITKKAFESFREDMNFYMENGIDAEDHEFKDYSRRELIEHFDGDREEVREVEKVLNGFIDLGSFYDYGLSFDFVDNSDEYEEDEDGEEVEKESYYRYQISWGGPSSEVRFYEDGTITYVYMDWFCGCSIDVTHIEEMDWLKGWFEDTCSIDWDSINEDKWS